MEKYLGLNVVKLYIFKNTVANEERPMSGPFDQCWLLHQTDMDHGVSIRVNCSVGPLLKLTKVLPESLYLIRYEVGNYYYMESLLEEIENYCIDLDKVLAKRGIYLDDFSDGEDAEIERYLEAEGMGRPWQTPPKAEFAQITANENGFCVFHPLEKRDNLLFKNWSRRNRRRIDVCYRPDSKKVQKGVLDYVSCKINIDTINTDIQAYFEKSLENEQMVLSQEE